MKVTTVLDMSKHLETNCQTTKSIHINYLCKHARTMCMMYEATGEQRYLQQARIDLDMASTIRTGFLRPLGVITSKKVA